MARPSCCTVYSLKRAPTRLLGRIGFHLILLRQLKRVRGRAGRQQSVVLALFLLSMNPTCFWHTAFQERPTSAAKTLTENATGDLISRRALGCTAASVIITSPLLKVWGDGTVHQRCHAGNLVSICEQMRSMGGPPAVKDSDSRLALNRFTVDHYLDASYCSNPSISSLPLHSRISSYTCPTAQISTLSPMILFVRPSGFQATADQVCRHRHSCVCRATP